MKNLSKGNNRLQMVLVVMVLVSVMLPEFAFAGNNGQQNSLKTLLNNPFFKSGVDLSLLIYAGYKWFMYFAEFDPSSAFQKVLVPAVMTFLAFQWLDVLGWIKLV